MTKSQDRLVQRLKYSPQDVYVFFEAWWKKVVEEETNKNSEFKAWPGRKECDEFLAKYGWNLPDLLIAVNIGIDNMVE